MQEDELVELHEVRGVKLVRIRSGAVITDEQVESLGRALSAVAEVPGQRIVLSFLGVEHLTSQALGKLIQAHKRITESGGEMVLADIDPRIYEVFSITRLDKLFTIHEREPDAIESLAPEDEEAEA